MISRRLREHPALLLAALPAAIALFDARYHEFWRDETSPILLGRALPWDLFFLQMRVEGIPFLFHALMKLVSPPLTAPAALLVVGALGFSALLFGTYRLLLSISGEPRRSALLTLLFSLTYVYVYELGVVVRQYALGLGLALTSMAYLRDGLRLSDRRSVALGALAGGLSAVLSAHSACVAGGGLAAFGLLALARRGGVRLGWPVLLALPAFALTFSVALPFPGRATEYNAGHARPLGALLTLGLQALAKSLAPSDWWYADLLPTTPEDFDRLAALRGLAFASVTCAAAVALVARAPVLARRFGIEGFDVLAVVISWVPLVEIVARHYWGFFRHHQFFSTPALVILAGWAADPSPGPRLAVVLRRASPVLAAPWLAWQMGIAAANLALDVRYPFAESKAFARSLPAEARVVSESDWATVGLLLWRPDLTLSAGTGGGRHYRYVIADNAWHARKPISELLRGECREAGDRVFFAGSRASHAGVGAACLSAIEGPERTTPERPQTWERFSMWRVDCACALRGR